MKGGLQLRSCPMRSCSRKRLGAFESGPTNARGHTVAPPTPFHSSTVVRGAIKTPTATSPNSVKLFFQTAPVLFFDEEVEEKGEKSV